MISYFIDLTDQVTKMTFYLIRLTSLVFEMTFYLIHLTDRFTKMILLFIRGRDAALGASEDLAGSTFRLAGNVGLSKGSLMLYWRRCDRPTSVPGAICG